MRRAERYLASGVIRGIGKALAKRIVDEFGEFTLQIIEKEPEKLCRIKGISPQKCEEIAESAQQIFGLRSLMGRLQAFSIPASVAMKAYRRWGAPAWELIAENPYRLCIAGIGLEFRAAERIAAAMQIPSNSPKRLLAGFRWLLETAALEGHTCLPYADFHTVALEGLGIQEQDYQAGYDEAIDEREIVLYHAAEGDFIYLNDYFQAEDFTASRIAAKLEFS